MGALKIGSIRLFTLKYTYVRCTPILDRYYYIYVCVCVFDIYIYIYYRLRSCKAVFE